MNPFRLQHHIRDILKFTAIVCGALALLSWCGVDLAFFADWPISNILPLGAALLCAFSIMRPRARSRRCESCGRRLLPGSAPGTERAVPGVSHGEGFPRTASSPCDSGVRPHHCPASHAVVCFGLLVRWLSAGSPWRTFLPDHHRLVAQSCSVVEFLCSEAERRRRFRAFLREPTKKSPTEEVFQRHFDYGFETLLEQWRQWVLARGIGSHGPAPHDIHDALTNRVIPLVEDGEANTLERIQAIREMGRTGYVLGADALIDLLGKDDQIPSKEVVWSLESISGLALGDDVKMWTEWFDHLPGDGSGVTDMLRGS